MGYDDKSDEVYTEGSDQYDNYFGCFDADMLTWSDEKLEKYVDDLLEKEQKEKEEKEIRRRQMQEDLERKEFERLKQKFG